MLAGLPPETRTTNRLADALRLDKAFTSRLLKAVRCRDPIAVTHLIPGPDPLRRMLRAARRMVDVGALEEAEASIREFETLIREAAGDRSTFDGIVGHLLPDARRQYESRTRQLLYRGACQLRGYSVDIDYTTILVHPNGDGEHVDYAVLTGVLGLRRLRPDVVVRLATWMMWDQRPPWALTTLDGDPIQCLTAGRLDQFCVAPPAEIEVERIGDTHIYTLACSGFGPQAAQDFVLGQWSHNTAPLYSPPGQRRLTGMGIEVERPTRLLHFDALLHRSVFPGVNPELFVIDTAFRGMANINEAARMPDRLQTGDEIQTLGLGSARFRTSEIPRYLEMLEYVGLKTGWNLAEFRGYRCVLEHPIYGTQVTMGFERPPPPTSTHS